MLPITVTNNTSYMLYLGEGGYSRETTLPVQVTKKGLFERLSRDPDSTGLCFLHYFMAPIPSIVIKITGSSWFKIYERCNAQALATSGQKLVGLPLPKIVRVHNNSQHIIIVMDQKRWILPPGAAIITTTQKLHIERINQQCQHMLVIAVQSLMWDKALLYKDGNNLFIVK